MIDIINNLYNFTLVILWGCVLISAVTVCYAIVVIKYVKKYIISTLELEKIKINNMFHKEDI